MITKMDIVQALVNARPKMDDMEALKFQDLFPAWRADMGITQERIDNGMDRYQYDGKLYKCRQAHTTQTGWEPDQAPALWEVIDPVHAGTVEDPIPYDQAMEVYAGKIYSYNDSLYECIRDSGNPLYAEPGELLGSYFNLIEQEEI